MLFIGSLNYYCNIDSLTAVRKDERQRTFLRPQRTVAVSIHKRRRQSVPIRSGGRNSRPEFRPPAASTYGFITVTFTMKNNMSLQSPDGGAAMGGIAAHGYVNGKAGAARQG